VNCPIYRGQLAVVPGRDEMYLWFINIDVNGNMVDEGIWRSIGGGTWSKISETGLTNCGDGERLWSEPGLLHPGDCCSSDGNGVTDLYAGAVNLFKCKLLNSQTSCSNRGYESSKRMAQPDSRLWHLQQQSSSGIRTSTAWTLRWWVARPFCTLPTTAESIELWMVTLVSTSGPATRQEIISSTT